MGGRRTTSKLVMTMVFGWGLLVLGSPGVARGERRASGWIERQLPPAGGAVALDDAIRIEVPRGKAGRAGARQLKVKLGRHLGARAVHPDFVAHGPRIDVGPGTRLAAEVSITAASMERRDGMRRALSVELQRDFRLGPFDPTVALPVLRPGRETAAWVMVPLEPRDDHRLAAHAGLVEGRRLQLGWVADRLAPPASGVPVGLGSHAVSLCVGRRGAVLELSTGEHVAVAPARGRSRRVRECDAVVLRRVRAAYAPRIARGAFTPAGPTFAVEGLTMASMLQRGRGSLTVPLRGGARAGRRLVLVLERIVNVGECTGSSSAGGCVIRWQRQGHLVVEAHLDDEGRAHARLPVSAQVGLRGGRMRFGWLARDAEGVEVIAAPRRLRHRSAAR